MSFKIHTSLALSHLTDHLIHSSLRYMEECTNICPIHQSVAAFKIFKKAQEPGRNTCISRHWFPFRPVKASNMPLSCTWHLMKSLGGLAQFYLGIQRHHDGQTKIFVNPDAVSKTESKSVFLCQMLVCFFLATLFLVFC